MKPEIIQKETENQLKESFDRIFVGEMVKNDKDRYESLKSISEDISGDVKLCLNKINTDLPFKKDINKITDIMKDLISVLPLKTDVDNISGTLEKFVANMNEQIINTKNNLYKIESDIVGIKTDIEKSKKNNNIINISVFTLLLLILFAVVFLLATIK